MHPLILYDANKPGDLEKAEALGADILRLCVEVGGCLTGEHGVGRREARPDGRCSTAPPTWRRSCGSRTSSTRRWLLNPAKVFPLETTAAPAGGVSGLAPGDRGGARRGGARRGGRAAGRWPSRAAAPAGSATRSTASGWRPRGLAGITLYEPGALTLVVRAGTPLAEVEAALAAEGQRLPFEPWDARRADRRATACRRSAAWWRSTPRGRAAIQAGACRDSLIGVRFVDGTGAVVKNGGRVMKNVTGLDLVKLMAGSHGTLGVLTEVAFKVLPQAGGGGDAGARRASMTPPPGGR